jgi:hypothetical protein
LVNNPEYGILIAVAANVMVRVAALLLFLAAGGCGGGGGGQLDADAESGPDGDGQEGEDPAQEDTAQDDAVSDETPALPAGKIRAAYTYSHSTGEAEIDLLLGHGIDTLIIKGSYDNNTDYAGETLGVPEYVRTMAAFARQKNFAFFQAINFSHYHFAEGTSASIVTDNFAVYADGRSSGHVSPWDEAYWNHLTGLVVNLARLGAEHPDEYRVDGVWFDFELYNDGDEPIFFSESWGFEEPTFETFIAVMDIVVGPVTGTAPPTGHDAASRAQRLGWLRDNELLDDYEAFLADAIGQRAAAMKEAVKAVNPAFLLGAYPSPVHTYLPEIYAGWSERNLPIVVWGTEMYNGGGADAIPEGLGDHLLPEGYYDLQAVYGGAIYGTYVGGLIAYAYPSVDFGYHLYQVARGTSGFWIWTTWSLTEPYEDLPEGYRVDCYDEAENAIRTCEGAEAYAEEAEAYLQQIGLACEELGRLEEDPAYVTDLLAHDPPPVRYEAPILVDPCAETLGPLEPQSGDILLDPPVQFRSQHNFVLYAEAGKSVSIEVATRAIGAAGFATGTSWVVLDPSGARVAEGEIAPGVAGAIAFTAAAQDVYTLLVNPGHSAFSFTRTNAPVMLYDADEIWTFVSASSIYVWVPAGVAVVGVRLSGGGGREGLSASIFKPGAGGYELADYGTTTELSNEVTLSADAAAADRDKVWRLDVGQPEDNPSDPMLEDAHINFDAALAPTFGLTDDPAYFMTVVP